MADDTEAAPDVTLAKDYPTYSHDDARPQSDPVQLRAAAKQLDDAHRAEATFHLSDESLKRAGVAEAGFRPETDEKTGAHTGGLRAAVVPEVHG